MQRLDLENAAEVTPRRAPPSAALAAFSIVGLNQSPSRPSLVSGAPSIRLVSAPAVGQNVHRSGWPFALACLSPLTSPDGVLFDDFIERTFAYGNSPAPHTCPWIGIFHHPHNMPGFCLERHRPQELFQSRWWQQSVPSLTLAFALTDYLADYLREFLPVPVAVARLPTGPAIATFSAESFLNNSCKRLIQIGWYLRNTRGIYQLPPLPRYNKIRLMPPDPWIRAYDARVFDYWQSNASRREYGGVEDIPRVSNDQYDFLLSCNVAFAEYFDVSASNLIIECLARNTPIITNRHPALMEYLGADYPLFFDRLTDVPELLGETTVLHAHEYLAARDKSFLGGDVFCQTIAHELNLLR